MNLQTKPDLEQALARFEAWWECEVIDRPPVTIHTRRDHPPATTVPAKEHASLRERWMDHEYKLDCLEAALDGAVFLAETFPSFNPNVGPEVCATVFGCELEFSEGTSWSIPSAGSCREILQIEPDFDSLYWQNILAGMAASIERGQGRWLTQVPDLHTNGDLLAALRDPQDLCLELMDDPEAVIEACAYVTDFFPRFYDDPYNLLAGAGQPANAWCPTLHAGRAYILQCDFICLISPDQFARAILPALQRETEYLDRSIYHLDGPEALRHLDAVLELPKLHGVQWVYGAGNEPAARWTDVYRRIQQAGKCMQVVCTDVADAKAVAEHLRPEGVWFTVGGGYSREEVRAFLAWTERWAAANA